MIMTMINRVAVAAAVLFFVSCKSLDVNPGAERVRVFEAEPKGCLYVGEVATVQEDKTVGTLETQMDLATRVDLRNKAHALGGNIIVFLKGKNTNTLPGSTGSPLAMKAGAKKGEEVQKTVERTDQSLDEVKTIVFLATVFKCPSSILNQ